MSKRDTTKRCFICTKFRHLGKNFMNSRGIEDEKKEKANNIIKHMRQKQIPKSLENETLSNEELVTQELGDSNTST